MPETDDQQILNQAEPMRQAADIERLRRLLADRPRDRLLFEMALSSGAPVKHLLRLRIADIDGIPPDGRLTVTDDRGQPTGSVFMNPDLMAAWRNFRARCQAPPEEYLFKSNKSDGHLKLASVTNMVNGWFKEAGLEHQRGIKSLQSTYRMHFAGDVPEREEPPRADGPLKVLKPVQMVAAHEVVYQGLLEAIISGTIPPGERLVPEKIAAMMNVSRMPVREALHRLRATGFVSAESRGTLVVNRLSRGNLEEIQHIRLLLEREAAGKAARLRSADCLGRLESIHERYVARLMARDIERAIRLNREFHLTIYHESGMPSLVGIIETLLDRVSPYLYLELTTENITDAYVQSTIRHHREILNGLIRRDAAAAKRWLTRDHRETTRHIVSLFR